MLRGVLNDIWPLAIALIVTVLALAALARAVRLRPRWSIACRLHRDQRGGVQSLSFVLTAPLFIMLMLLAVQITQLMIGLMIVHYAAFAAARSATVWVPARMLPGELIGENRIGNRVLVGRYHSGTEYRIEPGTEKFEQIRTAAALACVPIAPSRDLGLATPDATTGSLVNMYRTLAPDAMSNTRIPQRLANKWAWSNLATTIEIHTFHRDAEPFWVPTPGDLNELLEHQRHSEPPLMQYPPYLSETEFTPTEIGWRDPIRVTVTHQFALLPGPGRLLARTANQSRYKDRVAPRIRQQGAVYYIPLTATATMIGEGEKSLRPYVYTLPPK
jgi:hypothetical protein